ncbi:hypothetical protein HMPREF9141_2091 [Prevotella multiformis DSM 16608]|uniref:Uncharacterized protein n=1 Tax=Prevotella multiformis DSM 16608 TaxID=888743 RepID=F0F924_9BACT|nr:hypothetical protein HMPREF9141_2091 [Prevotella multiformis DSM 16608]
MSERFYRNGRRAEPAGADPDGRRTFRKAPGRRLIRRREDLQECQHTADDGKHDKGDEDTDKTAGHFPDEKEAEHKCRKQGDVKL